MFQNPETSILAQLNRDMDNLRSIGNKDDETVNSIQHLERQINQISLDYQNLAHKIDRELEAEKANQEMHQQLQNNLSTALPVDKMSKQEAEEYLQRELATLNQNAKILHDELVSSRQFIQPANDQSTLIPILQQINQIEVVVSQRVNELEREENADKDLEELKRKKDALYDGIFYQIQFNILENLNRSHFYNNY